jgi:hypothetical protein
MQRYMELEAAAGGLARAQNLGLYLEALIEDQGEAGGAAEGGRSEGPVRAHMALVPRPLRRSLRRYCDG